MARTTEDYKFRCWLKGEMYENFKNEGFYNSNGMVALLQGDEPIMQFTGLRDFNKKDIFEGDIIAIWEHFEDYDEPDEDGKPIDPNYICEVIWGGDYPAFELEPVIIDDCNSLQYCMIGYIAVVIGNIYENKPLFKNRTFNGCPSCGAAGSYKYGKICRDCFDFARSLFL